MLLFLLVLLLPSYVAGTTALQCAMWGPFMAHNCTVDSDGSCVIPPAPEGTRWNQTGIANDNTEISLHCVNERKIFIGGASIYCDSGEWRMRKLGYCEDIEEIALHGVYNIKGYNGPVENDGKYELKNDLLYKDGSQIQTCHGNTLLLLTDYVLDLSLPKKIPRKTIRYRPEFENGILYVDGIAVAKKADILDIMETDKVEGTFTVGNGNIYHRGVIVS
ncbi:hypothetical protein DICVIV_08127 [Dictyocaulus viviparus]|uniref:Sushi domain-containing protein n=1 Tax=Dictyocaulus viviparus TaxID=29172 RepID=A0A0D8XPW8_DICVI|nr:hypothetical protein DICVIV_08127 [Dictyocaulus viviparus]